MVTEARAQDTQASKQLFSIGADGDFKMGLVVRRNSNALRFLDTLPPFCQRQSSNQQLNQELEKQIEESDCCSLCCFLTQISQLQVHWGVVMGDGRRPQKSPLKLIQLPQEGPWIDWLALLNSAR